MNKTTLGGILIGAAVVIWAIQYYQQQAQIAAGNLTPAEGLTWTDRIFSPAGVALGVGVVLVAPATFRAVKR